MRMPDGNDWQAEWPKAPLCAVYIDDMSARHTSLLGMGSLGCAHIFSTISDDLVVQSMEVLPAN